MPEKSIEQLLGRSLSDRQYSRIYGLDRLSPGGAEVWRMMERVDLSQEPEPPAGSEARPRKSRSKSRFSR